MLSGSQETGGGGGGVSLLSRAEREKSDPGQSVGRTDW